MSAIFAAIKIKAERHPRLITQALAFALGLLFVLITFETGKVFHAHIGLLCVGAALVTTLCGLRHSLWVIATYIALLLIGTFQPQVFGASPDNGAAYLMLGTLGMLVAAFGISHKVRASLLAQTEVANEQRDAAVAAFQRSNLELEALLSNKSSELDRSVEKARKQQAEHSRLLALATMVSGLSHELGSPVGTALSMSLSLKGWANELGTDQQIPELRKKKLLERLQGGCEMVYRNITEMNRLLGSLKQISVENVDERIQHLNVLRLVEHNLVEMKVLGAELGVKVQIDVEPYLTIESFKSTLEIVIFHLIENAMKHGLERKTDPVLRIRARHIERKGVCQIDVSDNGWGIDSSLQKRIFEPFFTTKRGQGSIGMGLFIAHHLVVSVLKGTVELISKDTGTTFRVEFPIKTPILDFEQLITNTIPAPIQ